MLLIKRCFSLVLLLIFLIATGQAQLTNKQFTLMPASITGVDFRNDIVETENMFLYLYEYLYVGAGTSTGDINNDGLADLYFTSSLGSNKLYLNLGNFKFQDITASAGVDGGAGIKTGTTMIDINNDGYLDILICKSGYKDPTLRKKMLYINNKNNTFTNKAAEYGLEDASYSMQSYFFDFDNDGDKDVYFLNHPIDFSKTMTIPATMVNGKAVYAADTNTVYVSDRLYENQGGKFIDVTKKAGLINHAFGLSVSVADINNDGWPDLYVANDFNKPDYLYINNKNGTFTDKLSSYVGHVSFSAMGSDISDLNNDGLEDIVVMDMAVEEPVRQKQLFAVNQNYDRFQLLLKYGLYYQYPHNSFQLNNGNGTFSEISSYAGVSETDWSWSVLTADYDNDGWKDMYITNGLKRDMTDWDYKVFVLDSVINVMQQGKSVNLNTWLKSMPEVPVKNYFYRNNGTLQFEKVTDTWSDAPASFSSGGAYADLDNDGDLDLVVNNIDAPAFILKNNARENAAANNYLRFKFYKKPGSFEEVYGAVVTITNTAEKIQLQHYSPQRGFLSSSEHVLHFGTGAETTIQKIEIVFPSSKKITLKNIAANQLLTIYESDAISAPTTNIAQASKFKFTDITGTGKLNYTQKEGDFIDFKREPLIPYKCSRKGPYYAKADVNGDKLEDLFIGGAAGFEEKLMLQNANGNFTEKKQAAFASKKQEDMGALFFDADGDGDMDLYVVSGGAEFTQGDVLYQDRLYKNDGKGNFTIAVGALPAEGFNGSCVTALDYDADGDLDLFVGGHVLPGKFPKSDRSMLLQNNKGIFKDVTFDIAKALFTPGIVNQAIWADVDGDGKNELSISGEWMPLQIYSYENGQFAKKQNTVHIILQSNKDTLISMDAFTGWWYNMKAEDLNNDGKLDFVMGNRGLNCLIEGNINEPCTIYAKDFDNNGSYDAVLGYYNEGKCYPLFSRDQLIDQIPSMRKKFVRYKNYSGKTMDQIFTDNEKNGMEVFKTNFFASGVLMNEGNGVFRFIAFPEKAQFSTINDMVIDDIDNDGIKDILVCGNTNDPSVIIGVLDATAALLLKGTGKGNFEAVSPASNGLNVKGESRKMVYLKNNGKTTLVFLKNSAAAQLFTK